MSISFKWDANNDKAHTHTNKKKAKQFCHNFNHWVKEMRTKLNIVNVQSDKLHTNSTWQLKHSCTRICAIFYRASSFSLLFSVRSAFFPCGVKTNKCFYCTQSSVCVCVCGYLLSHLIYILCMFTCSMIIMK